MNLIGVDPSYNGLAISKYDGNNGEIECVVLGRKNIGKKFWETLPVAFDLAKEYIKWFDGEYYLFFEIPALTSRFQVAMFSLTSLLLAQNMADPGCKYIGIYNSSYLKSLLSGRGIKYSRVEMRRLGRRLAEILGHDQGGIDYDISASLLFLFSGMLQIWRSEGWLRLGETDLPTGITPIGLNNSQDSSGHHVTEGQRAYFERLEECSFCRISNNNHTNLTIQQNKSLLSALRLLPITSQISSSQWRYLLQKYRLNDLSVQPELLDLGGEKDGRGILEEKVQHIFPFLKKIVRVILKSELSLLKWGDSIPLKVVGISDG